MSYLGFVCFYFKDGGGTEHRIKVLVKHLQQLVYEYVCRSLFKADRLMFAMHMVHGMKPEMFEENVRDTFLKAKASKTLFYANDIYSTSAAHLRSLIKVFDIIYS